MSNIESQLRLQARLPLFGHPSSVGKEGSDPSPPFPYLPASRSYYILTALRARTPRRLRG